MPLTNGFIGEFLILLGTYQARPAFAIAAVAGVVLGAAYMLWMVKRVFFGAEGPAVKKEKNLDINWLEKLVLAPLIILIFWMGIYPSSFLKWSEKSISHFVTNKNTYELR